MNRKDDVKLITLGNSAVGKTSIIQYYAKQYPMDWTFPSLGVDLMMK